MLESMCRKRSLLDTCASLLLGLGWPASGDLADWCRGQGLAVVEVLLGLLYAGLDPAGDEFLVGGVGGAGLGVLESPYGAGSSCELGGDTDCDFLRVRGAADFAVFAGISVITGIASNCGTAGGECGGVWARCLGHADGAASSGWLRFHLATSALWLVRTWRATASMAAT